jgi:hypothetical protein
VGEVFAVAFIGGMITIVAVVIWGFLQVVIGK